MTSTGTSDARLSVQGLRRDFGGVRAVDDVSLSVPSSRVTGLIGPNGAGKTTVINLISGLLAVTDGTVQCSGADITHSPAHVIARAGVARTFQTSRLFAEMTVAENIRLAAMFGRRSDEGSMSSRQAVEARVAQALEQLGLTAVRDLPADSLSYGHRRKVEIARAVALAPSVLLLDEPVAGMHDAEAAAIADVLRDLVDDGMGLLLVEHNMRFVSSIADYLYVMNQGRLITEGEPREALTNPEVVRAYLGGSHAGD